MRKSISGFTVIELLIVISIIGILSTIGVVSYSIIQSNARDSQRSSKVTILKAALEKYYSQNGEYPGCAAMTQSSSEVVSTVLTGLDPDVLTAPTAAKGTNSITCIPFTINSGTDTFAYLGDGSTLCSTGASCLQYTFQYKKESTNEILSSAGNHEIDAVSLLSTGFASTSTNNTQAVFSWTASAYANKYNLQCALDTSFTSGLKSAIITGTGSTTGTVSGLTAHKTYYCRMNGANDTMTSTWSSNLTVATTTNFGTVAAATNPHETSVSAGTATVTWTGISCSLGTPLYHFVWVNPYSGSTAWSSSTGATVSNEFQGVTSTWKVETKCTFDGVDSSVASSANDTFIAAVSDPSGSWGPIGWDDWITYNANSNTFTCTGTAVEQYRMVQTLMDYTSGSWTSSWAASASSAVPMANQGSRITSYMQVRCYNNGVSSNVLSSGSRTDAVAVSAPGAVPGWCAGTCGSPKGDRWGAVACPTGTYAVYWSYAVGNYSNPIWGPYEAANFYGYDRAGYGYGDTMVNDYLMARCTSDFRTSGWGPQSYAYY